MTPSIPVRRFILPLIAALALTLLINAAAALADSVQPVGLKSSVLVAGPAITLGDIFTNAGAKAEVRIGDAPAAGVPLTLNAAALAGLARANGLAWQPASAHDKAVIERDSVAITSDEIAARIAMALTEKGIDIDAASVEPAIGNRPLYRPRSAGLAIDAITTDPAGRRFSAILAIGGAGQGRQTLPITGRLSRSLAIPVLNRSLRPGEAIGDGDLALNRVSEREIPANAVRDAAGLVGFTARRALAAGAPVLVSDLRPAKVVSKGQPVVLVLQAPGMQLTAGGIAMQDGSEGDAIRVVNERSHTVIKGIVKGDGTVVVASAQPVR